jgi:hypothetical protein
VTMGYAQLFCQNGQLPFRPSSAPAADALEGSIEQLIFLVNLLSQTSFV